MRLYPDKLDSHLAQHLLPVYLLSGDEPLQMKECSDRIRARARELGYSGCEVYVVDADFEWNQLLAASDSLSLFADQRLLELRLESGKPGREGGRVLKEYAARPAEDAVLLICSGRIDKASQSSAWYKALDKVGITLQLWPVSPRELPDWILQRMRAQGLHVTRDAVRMIAERVEGNMLAAQQEIDILALLFPEQEINVQEVLTVVGNNARFQSFDLADAALLGDGRRVVNILDGLRAEGIDAVPALIALAMQVRTATQLARSIARGQSSAQAMRDARVWQNRQNLFQQALMRHSLPDWETLLLRCAQVDLLSKGFARRGNAWDEVLELALAIAGKRPLEQPLSLGVA